jgi:hypothetical protein
MQPFWQPTLTTAASEVFRRHSGRRLGRERPQKRNGRLQEAVPCRQAGPYRRVPQEAGRAGPGVGRYGCHQAHCLQARCQHRRQPQGECRLHRGQQSRSSIMAVCLCLMVDALATRPGTVTSSSRKQVKLPQSLQPQPNSGLPSTRNELPRVSRVLQGEKAVCCLYSRSRAGATASQTLTAAPAQPHRAPALCRHYPQRPRRHLRRGCA